MNSICILYYVKRYSFRQTDRLNSAFKYPLIVGDWVTVHIEGYNVYTRVQTNIESLLRELSGPCPLRQVVDIDSKPRIWSHGTKAVSFENWSALQATGPGRTVTSSASTILYAGVHLDS